MTTTYTARIRGNQDAIQVANEIRKLSQSIENRQVEYHTIQKLVQNIMYETMSVLSPRSADFFSIAENRAAYYDAFQKQMQLAGLLRKDDSHHQQAHAASQ